MRDIFITSSILILAILLIRTLLKGRIDPRIQYALWLLVVIRLVLPAPLWNSKVSVMNFVPDLLLDESEGYDIAAGKDSYNLGAAENYNQAGAASGADTYNPSNAADIYDIYNMEDQYGGIDAYSKSDVIDGEGIYDSSSEVYITQILNLIKNLLPIIWAAGIVITGGYMLFYQNKWKRYLYANRKPLNGMEKYKDTLSVYTVDGLPSPCLSGRNIYLTGEMAENEEELEHILAHEYCHYRQFDSLWVIVRCVLTVVYWFNPLVWAAAYVSKQDSELACDEAVIRLLGENERIAYGKTLVKLVSGDGCERCRIGIASTMSGGEKGIKERISMIAGKPKYIAAAAAVVVLVVTVLIAVTFSGETSGDNSFGKNKEEEQLQTVKEELAAEAEVLKNNEEELQTMNKNKQLAAEAEVLKKKAAESTDEDEKTQLAALEAEIKAREAALNEVKAKEAALMDKISVYDEAIISANYQDGISDIKNYRDYMQGYINGYYVNQGEPILDEGIYQLMKLKGPDNTDIVVYGAYTKEYGSMGVKILIGEDINTYAMEWIPTYMLGLENISVYEKAKDGMPRSFAWKMPSVNTGDSEIWDLYICDRYDTGTVALSQFRREDYSKQIRERLTFETVQSEGKVYVYDNGEKVGEIDISLALAGAPGSDSSDSGAAMKKIKEVVWNENDIGWELGHSEEELKLITTVGLKFEGMEEVWYRNLNFISFPVECGSFGERTFSLGKAQIETDYENYWKHAAPDSDEKISYANP